METKLQIQYVNLILYQRSILMKSINKHENQQHRSIPLYFMLFFELKVRNEYGYFGQMRQ